MSKEGLDWENWLSWGGSLFLYVLPSPLLIDLFLSLLTDNFRGAMGSGGGYILFIAAATLLRRGLVIDMRRRRRPSSSLRALPLKRFSAILVGMAVTLVGFVSAAYSLPVSLAFGALAAFGCLLLYGDDRKTTSRSVGKNIMAGDDFTRVMEAGYARVDGIAHSSKKLVNAELRLRCSSIISTSKNILSYIESNPENFRNSRKFLNIYLDGAEKLIGQYVNAHPHNAPREQEQNFRTFLIEMDNTCREQYVKLQQKKAFDLDIQIEVLTMRLKHEGVG